MLQKPRLANTYKTTPDSNTIFNTEAVQHTITNILTTHLKDYTYEKGSSAELTTTLSGLIKSEVKTLDIPRYKLVCQVIINQKMGQAIHASSRCLWDEKLDNFACGVFVSDTVFAIGKVGGWVDGGHAGEWESS